MAQIVIRMVIAAIVRNFDIVSAPETTEESMKVCDSFVRGMILYFSSETDVPVTGYFPEGHEMQSAFHPPQSLRQIRLFN